ncbi:NADP-dependent oxidoreductase [bacterium]|nr:NADP-dependent oxidoreductase [bacterium]
MSTQRNFQVRLASRPDGIPAREHWELGWSDIDSPSDGEVLIETAFISIDPSMRGWLRDTESYLPPVAIGDVMRAGGVGTVIVSKHPDFKEGDQVVGHPGVQSYAVVPGSTLRKASQDVAPLHAFLGPLGIPGLTAYFGITEVGAVGEGDTVLVSAAAGAVGSIAGQIARMRGAGRVIGIAGSDEKCRHIVKDLGFDAAINYRTQAVGNRISDHAPEGIDVYFDNVGGDILDEALARLRIGGRVVLCGAISQYNDLENVRGPRNYLSLLVKRARMQGFIVTDFAKQFQSAIEEISGLLAAGSLRYRHTIVQGLETFPETFQRLFTGEKLGKLLIQVD